MFVNVHGRNRVCDAALSLLHDGVVFLARLHPRVCVVPDDLQPLRRRIDRNGDLLLWRQQAERSSVRLLVEHHCGAAALAGKFCYPRPEKIGRDARFDQGLYFVRLVKGCDPKCAPTDPADVPEGPTAMTAIYKHGVAVQYFDDAIHCRLYSESPIYK